MDEKLGFFGALFDFSFSEFITTKIIKILYGILICLAGLGTLAIIFSGFQQLGGGGIVVLIIAPIVFLLYVILARVWLEIVLVIFRIAEHTGQLVKQSGKDSPPAA